MTCGAHTQGSNIQLSMKVKCSSTVYVTPSAVASKRRMGEHIQETDPALDGSNMLWYWICVPFWYGGTFTGVGYPTLGESEINEML